MMTSYKRWAAALLGWTLLTGAWAKPQVFFSPEGGGRDQILRHINLTRQTIDLALFDLTASEIAEALENAARRRVQVRLVADRRQSAGRHSEIAYLAQQGLPIRLLAGKGRGVMHNKFAVFDGRIVVTGSYNWTENAEHHNYENLLVEDDPDLASRYEREFNALWERAQPLEGPEPALPDVVYGRWQRIMDWIRKHF